MEMEACSRARRGRESLIGCWAIACSVRRLSGKEIKQVNASQATPSFAGLGPSLGFLDAGSLLFTFFLLLFPFPFLLFHVMVAINHRSRPDRHGMKDEEKEKIREKKTLHCIQRSMQSCQPLFLMSPYLRKAFPGVVRLGRLETLFAL